MAFFDNFAAINLAAAASAPVAAAAGVDAARHAPTDRSWRRSIGRRPERPLLDRLLYADLKTYLVELLMKQDQMSMAASIESRVPFLDHHLVEFAWRLAPDRKLSGFTTKRILRDAIADVVPTSILTRPKAGFPVPFGALAAERLACGGPRRPARSAGPRARPLAPAGVERLVEAAARGVHGTAEAVWSLVNLELWFRTFIDGEGVQTLPSPLPATRSGAADPQLVAS